jgi:hypothetical protein
MSATEQQQPLLSSLPSELLQRIASYLVARQAVNVACVSKLVHKNLSLASLPPRMVVDLMQEKRWNGDSVHGESPQKAFPIPIPSTPLLHSVQLSFHWKDQGWGHQKGNVWIVESESETENDDTKKQQQQRFHGGRVVYASPVVAPHHFQPLVISIRVKQKQKVQPQYQYHLWIKAGGGGGHSLTLQNIKLSAIVFDPNYADCYKTLMRAGVLGPFITNDHAIPMIYTESLLLLCKQLALVDSNNETPPNNHDSQPTIKNTNTTTAVNFMKQYGFTTSSIAHVQEILEQELESTKRNRSS